MPTSIWTRDVHLRASAADDPQLSPLLRRNDYRKLTRNFNFAI
jgi:hypothetical protein